jgi:galactose mutarotase-like enzyme
MIRIENDFLKVIINFKGAELSSLFNKLNGLEHLWQADPAVWGFHAPNLFPIVGSCIGNQIMVDGKKYPLKRHGFARHSEFILLESTRTRAKLLLNYSESTLTVFPFKFAFEVIYELHDSELRVLYQVINHDNHTMYFSIGAHPAFNIPFFEQDQYSDYYIEFPGDEILEQHLLNSDGHFTGKTKNIVTELNRIDLRPDLFKSDALVFKNLTSRQVLIKNHKNSNFISISFPDFNSLGIWAPVGASFVCIEPWLGYADNEGEIKEFSQKEGVLSLKSSESFKAEFIIGVH